MKLINSLVCHFQRFQTYAINRMVPLSVQEEDSLSYWRVRILFAIIFTGVLIGLLAFVPVVVFVIKRQLWGLLIFDGILWIIGAGLLMIRGLKYNIRSGIALLILYALGLGIIVFVGPLSGGPMSLFTFAVLSGVLLGSKAAFMALIINALTLTIVGWIINAGMFGQSFPFFSNIEAMIAAGVTFILLNTVAAMSVVVLVKGLISTLQKEKDLSSILKREQSHLVEVKNELESKIVAHNQALEDLRTSEEKYRLLAENVTDVIWTMDLDLNYTYISPAIEKMQGWTSEEVASLTINDLLTPHSIETAVKRLETHIAHGAKTGDYNISDMLELELYRKDGSTILVEIVASAILDEGGKLIGILGVTRDITERKELEVQLLRSQKMESVGLLAGGVAHDLNNVLSGIVSYPELILMDLPEDSKLRKPIETMQDSGLRATAIVQDLLTVARGVAAIKEPLNLNDLVYEYLNSPEFKKLKQFNPTVTVITNLDNDLLNVNGSYVHIRKVVMNLVSNASEAIKDYGSVTVSTKNCYVEGPFKGYDSVDVGEYAVLEVSDNGSGIPSHDLKRIFEPFYTKKVMGRSGTGLGLAVVWNTVQDHNGHIDVTSDKKGTTFKLYFPITRNAVPDKALPIPVKDYKGNGEILLVVDDVESQREISCKMLESLDYQTHAVSSGEKAIEFIKENSIDLMLIDMIMDPGINGRETYARVLKLQPNQKAIIVSGYAETDEVKATQKLGAGRYVKKPLTLEKLGLAVKAALEK